MTLKEQQLEMIHELNKLWEKNRYELYTDHILTDVLERTIGFFEEASDEAIELQHERDIEAGRAVCRMEKDTGFRYVEYV